MLRAAALCLSVLAVATESQASLNHDTSCDVRDFGAVGDGIQDDTAAIQSCLDACGGDVAVPEGQYLVSQLRLTGEHVSLHLHGGAHLLASPDREAYSGGQDDWYAVLFDECTGCKLRGHGDTSVIDGQAKLWVQGTIKGDRYVMRNWADGTCAKPTECRPRLLGVRSSQGVDISGVRVANGPFWMIHIVNSTDVAVSQTTISGSRMVPNNDGIDIDSSTRVRVSGCAIDTADDGVCVKTTLPGRPVTDVLVTDCVITSRSSAIKLGSESRSDFSNITFANIEIRPSHRALGVQLRDEGSMSGIAFRNITLAAELDLATWWGNGEAIAVTCLRRTAAQRQLGTLRDISFQNVSGTSESGVLLVGHPTRALRAVTLRDVRLTMRKSSAFPGGVRDLRPGVSDVERGVQVAAVYARDVDSLVLEGVVIHVPDAAASRPDWGPALAFEQHTIARVAMSNVTVTDDGAFAAHLAGQHAYDMHEQGGAAAEGRTCSGRLCPSGRGWPAGGVAMALVFFGMMGTMAWTVATSAGLGKRRAGQLMPESDP